MTQLQGSRAALWFYGALESILHTGPSIHRWVSHQCSLQMDQNYPDCQDKDGMCESWAGNGECEVCGAVQHDGHGSGGWGGIRVTVQQHQAVGRASGSHLWRQWVGRAAASSSNSSRGSSRAGGCGQRRWLRAAVHCAHTQPSLAAD